MSVRDTPIFEARGLTIRVAASDGRPAGREIVRSVDFVVPRGKVVALIGESGSGKTTIALSALGYTRPGLEFSEGSALVDGRDVTGLSRQELGQLRGPEVAYVAQSAAAAFNPAMRIGDQVIESAILKGAMSRSAAIERARNLYEALDLPDPSTIGDRFPHQVSGGQLQRLMMAMALCTGPKLLVLDEPTTALDVTTQIEVLKAVNNAIAQEGSAAIYVSHDLAVVAQVADDIVVLYDGEVMEKGSVETIISAPQHSYTRRLMDAVPKVDVSPGTVPSSERDIVLEAQNITAGYGKSTLPAVLQDVQISVGRGRAIGIIGESGSGKSTLGRVLAGLLAPRSGKVLLDGQVIGSSTKLRPRETLRKVQFVFQMADTALNPHQTIEEIIGRPLTFYAGLRGRAKRKRTSEILDRIGLPEALAKRRPFELSGGQKQRVNLARALAADPEVLICDEVTSALDTIVAANIMELLENLRRDLGVSFVFISHDLSTVSSFADEIIVLYGGRIVESGKAVDVLSPPFHPYTRLLVASAPELRTGWLEDVVATQSMRSVAINSAKATAHGCPFFDRCPLAIPGTCDEITPPLQTGPRSVHHVVACHYPIFSDDALPSR